MMKLLPKNRDELRKAALGIIPSDLAIHNVKLCNVLTGEIYPATVYVKDGFIAYVDHETDYVDEKLAKEIVDGKGYYLTPGLMNAHEHIESSMLVPYRYAEAVVPWGTTTIIQDPHEIANVLGRKGVRYMHEAGNNVPMRQFVDIPSSLPAVNGMEGNGAKFDYEDIRELAKLERVVGLAEVMNFIGLAYGSDPEYQKLVEEAEKCGLYIQGHVITDDPRILAAYRIAGPNTCHETSIPLAGKRKMRGGIRVDGRNGTMAHNIEVIWNEIKDFRYLDRFCLCTDDQEVGDTLDHGHMNNVINVAIKAGMDPMDALRSATYSIAVEANIENIGAIAPGYVADMLLVKDLNNFVPETVYFAGRKVAEHQKLLEKIEVPELETEQINTMNIPEKTVDDFHLKTVKNLEKVEVNVLAYEGPTTSFCHVEKITFPVRNHCIDISGHDDICFATVINRYGENRQMVGLVKGFGLKKGANGSTVSHDSHNLCIVYKTAEEGYKAYKAIEEVKGGMSCVVDDEVTVLPLPVAGLMSTVEPEEMAKQTEQMKAALRKAGLDLENPILRIVTLALPVVPYARFSDMGLIDTINLKFVDIVLE